MAALDFSTAGISGATPFANPLQNISGALSNIGIGNVGAGTGALGSALPGQQNLAALLAQLGGQNVGAGSAAGFDIQSLLGGAGGNLLQQGIQTESTGQLPTAAQPLFATQLSDSINDIKGKFASLGMSGSTAEQSAITDAQNRNAASQFTAAETLGGQQVQQGLSSLTTGGSLATTLAQLGMTGFNLSSSDLSNIAQEGLQQMGLGTQSLTGSGSILQNLASSQISQDNNLLTTFQNFFKALAAVKPS